MCSSEKSLNERSDPTPSESDLRTKQVAVDVAIPETGPPVVPAEITHEPQPRIRVVRQRRAAAVEIGTKTILAYVYIRIATKNFGLRRILSRSDSCENQHKSTKQCPPFHLNLLCFIFPAWLSAVGTRGM